MRMFWVIGVVTRTLLKFFSGGISGIEDEVKIGRQYLYGACLSVCDGVFEDNADGVCCSNIQKYVVKEKSIHVDCR